MILPKALAEEFRTFCERNPKSCQLLDETAPGDPVARKYVATAVARASISGPLWWPLFRRRTAPGQHPILCQNAALLK